MTLFMLVIICLLFVIIALLLRPRKADGQLVIKINEDGSKIFSLELNDGVESIESKKKINFKVERLN